MPHNDLFHHYLFLFHVQHGLKKLKTRLQEASVASSVIDAPRKITTECETALAVQFSAEDDYLKYTGENIREIWRIDGSDYQRVWADKMA
ncbi:DUF3343 domain-containing protein [Morganella morganii]|uniref:DUF3343 domain-containing protein n=1 Tax=Morganella morganii TaxID=582 RepID=UPI0021CED6A8|nr:DUF3343 domain-containing protein [Morganella morganii]MCU6376818.1 DUF3343 domain-containing protein [Morganella morganii]